MFLKEIFFASQRIYNVRVRTERLFSDDSQPDLEEKQQFVPLFQVNGEQSVHNRQGCGLLIDLYA